MKYLKIFEDFKSKDTLDLIAEEYRKSRKIDSIKRLNDEFSQGRVYITNKNKLIKITTSKSEYDISNNLLKNPNNNFPLIYDCIKKGKFYLIYKEYIPSLNKIGIKKINTLEKVMEEVLSMEYEDNGYFDLLMHKIEGVIDIKYFEDFLEGEYPELVNFYNDLKNIYKYSQNLISNKAVDLHVDNFGIRNDKLVAFDY